MKSQLWKYGMWLLAILALIDGISTHIGLQLGVAVELNPILAWAFSYSPILFWTLKVALTTMALALLHAVEEHRNAGKILAMALATYAVLAAFHFVSWVVLFVSN